MKSVKDAERRLLYSHILNASITQEATEVLINTRLGMRWSKALKIPSWKQRRQQLSSS
jgi:hypothetical protein